MINYSTGWVKLEDVSKNKHINWCVNLLLMYLKNSIAPSETE